MHPRLSNFTIFLRHPISAIYLFIHISNLFIHFSNLLKWHSTSLCKHSTIKWFSFTFFSNLLGAMRLLTCPLLLMTIFLGCPGDNGDMIAYQGSGREIFVIQKPTLRARFYFVCRCWQCLATWEWSWAGIPEERTQERWWDCDDFEEEVQIRF